MAITFDTSGQAVLARRRARGKNDTVFLRLERGSLRVGALWAFVIGWAPRRWPEGVVACRCAGGVGLLTAPRIARYVRERNLTVSGARLGPWQWLVVADPFAYERMVEWETSRSDVTRAARPGRDQRTVPHVTDTRVARNADGHEVAVSTRHLEPMDELTMDPQSLESVCALQ